MIASTVPLIGFEFVAVCQRRWNWCRYSAIGKGSPILIHRAAFFLGVRLVVTKFPVISSDVPSSTFGLVAHCGADGTSLPSAKAPSVRGSPILTPLGCLSFSLEACGEVTAPTLRYCRLDRIGGSLCLLMGGPSSDRSPTSIGGGALGCPQAAGRLFFRQR